MPGLFPDDVSAPLRETSLAAAPSLFPDSNPAALKGAVDGAQAKTPDVAARVLKLQTRTGLPAELIERNVDEIEREASARDFDPERFRRESPKLAQWLAQNPQHAALAKDDLANLGVLEWIVTAPGRAFRRGQSQVEFGNLSTQSIFRDLTSDEHARMRELRASMQAGGDLGAETWFGKALTGGAQQLPMLFGGLIAGAKTGVPAAMGAAGAVALAGQAGPQIALPEEIATVPIAAATGYYVGQTAGAARFGFTQEAGHAFEEFSKFKDELGRPLDRDVARAAAIAAGAVNSGLEAFQLNTLMRSIPGADKLAGAATRSAISQALAAPTVRGALKELMLGYGRVLTLETATEVAQRAMTIMSGEIGKVASGQSIPLRSASEIGLDLASEAVEAAQAFTYLAGAGPVVRSGHDAFKIREAKKNEAFFTALGEGVQSSKTFERMPEKLREFIAEATRDGPIETVYVDPGAWSTYWQSQKVDPAVIAREVMGEVSAYEEALREGHDLAIPMSAYATKLAPTEHNAFFAQEMRLGPDEMNAREAIELETRLKAEADAAAGARETQTAAVREDIVGQLLATGMDQQTAETNATLVESFFKTTAERAGLDVNALYKQFGLTVSRPMPDVLKRLGNVNELDALIDRLRAGEIPKGADMFGASLADFIRDKGGIREEGGEMRARDLHVLEKGRKREQRILRVEGRSFDEMREIAAEAGYLAPDSTINDFLDALDNELRGEPVYAPGRENENAIVLSQQLEQLDRYLKDRGLDLNALTNEQIKAELDKAMRDEGATPGVTFDQSGKPMLMVDGKLRPITNSKGQPIAQDIAGLTAFWKWFGDSKVVDAEGQPLVMYHGTDGDFSEFDKEKIRAQFPQSIGLHFTDRASEANIYASGELDPKMPPREGANVRPVYLKTENPLRIESKHTTASMHADIERNDIIRAIVESRRAGTPYDGILIARDRGDAWDGINVIVFEPTQVKSAVGNVGTFDPVSGNILHQPAYHGSPHDFDKFSLDKVGTGEGAQAYGWGLYFAENPGVAQDYQKRLSDASSDHRFTVDGNELDRNSPERHAASLIYFGDVREVRSITKQWLKEAEAGDLGLNDTAAKAGMTGPEYWGRVVEFARTHTRRQIKASQGNLYAVHIDDRHVEKMLDLDAPLAKQPEAVKDIVRDMLFAQGYLRAGERGPRQLTTAFESYLLREGGMVKQRNGHGIYDMLVNAALRYDGNPVNEIFRSLGKGADQREAASKFLLSRGIPGSKYFDAGSRSRKRGSRNLVVFDDSIVEITHKNGTPVTATERKEFLQDDAQDGKRGAIRFGADRKFDIDLLAKADLSTFIHETGHFYLEVMGDVVDGLKAQDTLDEKQQRMIEDYATVLKWIGVESRDQIGTEHHEQWARGIEAYVMEGKAPSPSLRQVFARFRAWLVAIYRSLTQLNVTLTPEVKAVMDRLFATDAEITAAEKEADIQALFATAEAAGMSETEFAAYRGDIAKASEVARDQLQAKLMRQLQRERESQWKIDRLRVREEVSAEVYALPEYVALSHLSRGTLPNGEAIANAVKLDRDSLIEQYGKEFLKRLPRPYVYAAEGGIRADAAAELFGFDSGDALVTALVNARPMKQLIEAETDQRMRERHGDMLLDGTLHDAARVAVQNEERSKVIHAEMRALAKKRREVSKYVNAAKSEGAEALEREQRERAYERRWFDAEHKLAVAIEAGEKQAVIDRLQAELSTLKAETRSGAAMLRASVPALPVVRAMAQGRIAQMRVRDIQPVVYWNAARKAGAEAIDLAARNDFDAALMAKQRELLNVELYRAAVDAREEAEAIVDYMRSFTAAGKRQRIGKAGGDYLEQIDAILERFDFSRVSLRTVDRRKSLAAWVAEQERQGIPVNLPDDILDETLRISFKDMTYEQLVGVRDGVRHIEHLARLKNRLLTKRRQQELDAAADEVATSVRNNVRKPKGRALERLPKDEALREVDKWFASHRKISSIARVLDGQADAGAMWEYFVRPLNEAGDREAMLNEAATVKLAEIFETAYRGKEIAALYHKTFIPEIGTSLSRMARITIALNWGNADSRQKVMDGGLDGQTKLTQGQVDAILDGLDLRDWQFVQAILDHINSYWPEIEAKEKRVNGVAPEKVMAAPIATKYGEFKGGYFPLKYDERKSPKVYGHRVEELAKQMMSAGHARATTRRGHTKARVEGVELPIRLDFGVIFEHVNQVIHDVSHHETLLDVTRLLRHKAVADAIIESHGEVTYDQFRKLFEDVAAGEVPAVESWEKAVNYLRQGATIAGMGWNVSTALLQPFGLSQSMSRIGVKWVGKGISRWMHDLSGTAEWIANKSDLMRLRAKTQMREINEIRNKSGLNTGKFSGWIDEALRVTSFNTVTRQGIVDSYFWLIYKGQQVADIPTWLGAYEKAMAGSSSEAEAIALADQAVLDSQGGGQIKDLARVQRGGPLLKAWTNFYSYFNVTYNLTAEALSRTRYRDPISIGRLAVDLLLLYTLPASLAFMLKHALKGDNDDDLGKKLIQENLSYMLGTMIGLREIGSAVQGYAGYEGPAGARFWSSASKVITQAGQGEVDEAFLRAVNDAAGVVLHFPAGQVRRTVEGLTALWEGRSKNPLAVLLGPPKE